MINRGGTLWEKEAAEVPQRDPAATEVLCRPEVLCGKRKQQRYPDGTLLQQRYSADQRYSVGKGSVLKKKKNILKETSDQLLASHYTSSQNPPLVNHHHHDRGHYMFYPSSLLFLPLDVLALTPSSPNTYPRTYHMCVCTILTYIHT